MTDFLITRPSRGTDTLHVVGCKNVHRRATIQPLPEAALGWYPALWGRVDESCVTPALEEDACAQWDATRTEWDAEQERERLAREAADYRQWLARRADELEYLHQFMPLRDALRPLYPEVKVTSQMSSANWKFHPSVDFSPELWRHNIALHHDRATGHLLLERVGNIDGLVLCSADAYRLGSALSIIENFVITPF